MVPPREKHIWRLHPKQSVQWTSRSHVAFRHHTGKPYYRGVALTLTQFDNFCHHVHAIKDFPHRNFSKSLGGKVILEYTSPKVKLMVYSSDENTNIDHRFFQFYNESWDLYKSDVHDALCSFLFRHDRQEGCQSPVANASQSTTGTRVSSPSSTQRKRDQTLFRTSLYAPLETEKRKDSTTISKRCRSTLGKYRRSYSHKHVPPYSSRTPKNDVRTNTDIESTFDQEYGSCIEIE